MEWIKMPHLVYCAASAPLHELPLCEMDAHRLSHDQKFRPHHQTHHRKCSKVAVQDRRESNQSRPWEVVHMFRAAYDSFVHPQSFHPTESIQVHRTSVSGLELRQDLVAIPRVGFPPTNSQSHIQPISMQSNLAPINISNQIYSPMPTMAIPVQHAVVHQSPIQAHVEGGSRAVIFTRIEAIYI